MKLKIVLVGPKGAGKTSIGNYLVGQSQILCPENANYDPTAGVRILEFEARNHGIELWDASGDHKYETCWKAIMADTDGVVLVYNPDAPSQDQQINDWFDYFVKKNGLKDEQCMILAHKTSAGSSERFRPPPLFSRVSAALTGVNSGPDIKAMFDKLAAEIASEKQQSSSRK